MYLFKWTGSEKVYENVKKVQQGLGPRIWGLMMAQFRESRPADGHDFPWQVSGADLVQSLLSEESESEKLQHDKYKFVADVLNVLGNPSNKYAQLFEVTDIFGYSEESWTPMMWKLRHVAELEDCTEARSQNRWEFDSAGEFVYEFLRLNAGYKGGRSRGFGMVGSYNGVLLWPRARTYFLTKIDATG